MASLIVLLLASLAWGQGYSMRSDRVVVDQKDHWQHWIFPENALSISEDGEVRPHFVRKKINASLNASEFVHGKNVQGGIWDAGTNKGDAESIMDGDISTYWEPDWEDPLEDWWVVVDLGRLVCAERVVLRFVDEGEGDPFLHFKVLTATGEKAFAGAKVFGYKRVGSTQKSNLNQRVFEFEIEPPLHSDPEFSGNVVQYVQVIVTDSKLDRREEITQEEYEALSTDRRGAVVYHRREPGGREREVSREDYERIEEARRGSIRYYRREVPRLAEVEVWTVGENIALGVIDRRGGIEGHDSGAGVLIDGDYVSVWLTAIGLSGQVTKPVREVFIDLGAWFWVDEVRIMFVPQGGGQGAGNTNAVSWENYTVDVSDGTRAPDGSFVWETLRTRQGLDMLGDLIYHDTVFQPSRARFMAFRYNMFAASRWYVSATKELMIYGEGYLPEVVLTSDLIELGSARNLTTVEWDATIPPGTNVEIRTRTGDTLDEVKHFYRKNGVEVTELQYNKLASFDRGPTESEFVPGSDWSTWSHHYRNSGDPILSPSPRKYLMIEATLASEDPDAAASLHSVALNFLDPVAKQVVGEISPSKVDRIGVPQEFSYFIHPSFAITDQGFDEVLIKSPPDVKMELLGVRIGKEEGFLEGTVERLAPEALDVVLSGEDSLWIRLPEVLRLGRSDLVEVQFATTLYLSGTVFDALVGNRGVPGSWQRVDAGDATVLVDSQLTKVFGPSEDRIIRDVEIGPNPFTPNGDGLNDEVGFGFTVFKVNASREVKVTIYGLDGKEVAELSERPTVAAGRHRVVWDGRDGDGGMVSPGIYVARLSVDADWAEAKDATVDRLVYVVY